MLSRPLIRWIGVGGMATALIAGGVSLQQVAAQDPAPTEQAESAPEQRPLLGPDGPKGQHKGIKLRAALVRATVELTGMEPAQVREQLAAGKSLAQIAADHGSSGDAVVGLVLQHAEQRLSQAVADGRLMQEQADARLAQLREAAGRLVQEPGLRLPEGRPGQGAKGMLPLIAATAEVTGLEPAQVREQLAAGKSLAQIAADHGKTADDILALLRSRGEERLNRILEHARQMIEQAPDR